MQQISNVEREKCRKFAQHLCVIANRFRKASNARPYTPNRAKFAASLQQSVKSQNTFIIFLNSENSLANSRSIFYTVITKVIVIAFAVKVIIDYTQYTVALNSAPFYVWVLVDALFLALPAIIVFSIGRIAKKLQ